MIPATGRAVEAEAARILAAFAMSGAERVDLPVLQPAGTMLDLYGEDIRARAYVTRDPLAGEMMLRPDFTVPVVQMHMAEGRAPARYVYAGKVFRTQESETGRPSEYDQVGFEIFDGTDPARAEAEVFALLADALAGLPVRAATGDIGVLMAAVRGLATSERRKAALARHIWRPRRFRALLERFAGRAKVPEARAALLAEVAGGGVDPASVAPVIGLRAADEISARIAALAEDAETPPISALQVDLLEEIVGLRDKAPVALERLSDIAVDLGAIQPALDRMSARLDALSALGVDVEALDFEGSYGRTSMEYYDGFVFGFYADGRADMPPVATGGRYDALTRALGGAEAVPAVGGVIRPALSLALEVR